MSQPGRLIGNLVAVICVLVAALFLTDKAWTWLGGEPFAMCAYYGAVELVFGRTLGLLLMFVGFAAWLFSGLRQGGYLAVGIGGIAISMVPDAFADLLGAACT